MTLLKVGQHSEATKKLALHTFCQETLTTVQSDNTRGRGLWASTIKGSVRIPLILAGGCGAKNELTLSLNGQLWSGSTLISVAFFFDELSCKFSFQETGLTGSACRGFGA